MRRTYEQTARELESEYGELLDAGASENVRSLSELRQYADDPVGFIRDVLGCDPWSVQRDVARSVLDNRKTAVAGCNGLGKDWIAARLSAWWAWSVDGLCILTGPTERQVHEVLMRKELARAKKSGRLPGELYTEALRIRGEEASIIAKTASGVSDLTGFHDARVLAILTEAQGCEAHAWEAMQACATGADDRLLAVGNPLDVDGRFYRVAA